MDKIGFLADSIELLVGIDQTPAVNPIRNGKYKIIAGHRRKDVISIKAKYNIIMFILYLTY